MYAYKSLFNDARINLKHYPRIPHQGSKNGIAKDIIQVILNLTTRRERFVDAFCGGGGVAYPMFLTKEFNTILASDNNEDLINLHNDLPELDLMYIAKTPCLLRPSKAIQEIYPNIKLIDEIEEKYRYAFKICYSFGNNCASNLFGSNNAVKYVLSDRLFNNPGELSETMKEPTGIDLAFEYGECTITGRYNDYKKYIRKAKQSAGLKRLEQLGHNIIFSTKDYREINYNILDVVYFDIPYEGTADRGYKTKRFDNKEFEEFARNLNCPVFISEYKNEIEGFIEVMGKEKLCTLNNKNSNKAKKLRIENLFWNGVK